MKLFTSRFSARLATGAVLSLALAFTASSASAQYGRNRDSRDQILQWSGSVDREIQIVQLLSQGLTSKRIGTSLGISVKTVETHRASAMHKLKLKTTADLVRYAIRNSLIEP